LSRSFSESAPDDRRLVATKESEAGPPPKPEAFAAMQKYNEEAVVRRAPNVFPNGEVQIEIRKLMDIEDFGDGFTPNPEIAKVKYK